MKTTFELLLLLLIVLDVYGMVRRTGWPWIYNPTCLYERLGFLYNVVTNKCVGADAVGNSRSEPCANQIQQLWSLRDDQTIGNEPINRYLDPIGSSPVPGSQVKYYNWSVTGNQDDAKYYLHFPDELPVIFEIHLLNWANLCLNVYGDALTADYYQLQVGTCGMDLQNGDSMWQFFPACILAQTGVDCVAFEDELSNSNLRRNTKVLDSDPNTCVTLKGPSQFRLYISKPTESTYTVNLTKSSSLACDKIKVQGKISDNIDLVAVTYKPSFSRCIMLQESPAICQYTCNNEFSGLVGACEQVYVFVRPPGGDICEAIVSSP